MVFESLTQLEKSVENTDRNTTILWIYHTHRTRSSSGIRKDHWHSHAMMPFRTKVSHRDNDICYDEEKNAAEMNGVYRTAQGGGKIQAIT